jgi:hypothetical protein
VPLLQKKDEELAASRAMAWHWEQMACSHATGANVFKALLAEKSAEADEKSAVADAAIALSQKLKLELEQLRPVVGTSAQVELLRTFCAAATTPSCPCTQSSCALLLVLLGLTHCQARACIYRVLSEYKLTRCPDAITPVECV